MRAGVLWSVAVALAWGGASAQQPPREDAALRVCADPHSLPQSNDRGEGYELTATTKPYMHSIYALVLPSREEFKNLQSADDLLRLPSEKLHSLRIGLFAQTPAADWVLKNGLIDRAVMYAAQSGDPNETPNSIIERDLAAGKIDVAVVWGPVAGFLVSHHTSGQPWLAVPFKPDPTIRFDYEIAMGLRQGEKEWQNTLDDWIAAHQAQITQILASYHIPLLEESPSPQG